MKLLETLCGGSPMARCMKLAALVAAACTMVFALLHVAPLAITAGTFAYHLLMRLAVGFARWAKSASRWAAAVRTAESQ